MKVNGWNIITEVDGSDPFSFLLEWVIICRFQAVHLPGVFPSISIISCLRFYRIHGTGIFYTYIYHWNQPNVGRYSSPMDPMELQPVENCLLFKDQPSPLGKVTHNQNATKRTAWFLKTSRVEKRPKTDGFLHSIWWALKRIVKKNGVKRIIPTWNSKAHRFGSWMDVW